MGAFLVPTERGQKWINSDYAHEITPLRAKKILCDISDTSVGGLGVGAGKSQFWRENHDRREVGIKVVGDFLQLNICL